MRQNICCGYFAFSRPQTVEMVTWSAQYRETQPEVGNRYFINSVAAAPAIC